MCFALADRLRMDVRVILEWPLPLIYEWAAYYKVAEAQAKKKGSK